MRRLLLMLTIVGLLLSGLPGLALADQQVLTAESYKYYSVQDIVFVAIRNTTEQAVENLIVNLTIREGMGRNRVLAVGQAVLDANLVLRPGESTSARVPIQRRLQRDIPALAQFDFYVTGLPAADAANVPHVVVQGGTLRFHRALTNGIPLVSGFVGLDPTNTEQTSVEVESAVYTFYDRSQRVVWSETVPIDRLLVGNESIIVWQTYDQLTRRMVPDISYVEAVFVAGAAQTN